MATKKNKKSVIKRSSKPMSVALKQEKVRLVLTCTKKEKIYIKMLAAKENKTISDYLLSYPRTVMPKTKNDLASCKRSHKPNKLTEKVLRESEQGENIESHDSIEDFWKSMGINPNA